MELNVSIVKTTAVLAQIKQPAQLAQLDCCFKELCVRLTVTPDTIQPMEPAHNALQAAPLAPQPQFAHPAV
jgi:hypothetical protein